MVSLRGKEDTDPLSPVPGSLGGVEWDGQYMGESQAPKETGRERNVPHPQAKVKGEFLTEEQGFQRAVETLWNEGCNRSRCWRRR